MKQEHESFSGEARPPLHQAVCGTALGLTVKKVDDSEPYTMYIHIKASQEDNSAKCSEKRGE